METTSLKRAIWLLLETCPPAPSAEFFSWDLAYKNKSWYATLE